MNNPTGPDGQPLDGPSEAEGPEFDYPSAAHEEPYAEGATAGGAGANGSAGKQVEPSPDVDELASGVPYRALAMVLLALVVIAVAVGLAQLLGGDDEEPAPAEATSQSAQAPPQNGMSAPAPAPAAPGAPDGAGDDAASADAAEPAAPSPSSPEADAQAPAGAAQGGDTAPVNVIVYNNSLVTGLADQVAGQLRGAGANVTEVGNYADANIPTSGVYYGTAPGEQAEAERLAAELGIEARPRPGELSQAPGGVIVIVTQDLQR